MRTANDYRKTWPNKTDDQIIASLGNEVKDKVETIHRLLKEKEDSDNRIKELEREIEGLYEGMAGEDI